MIYIFKYIHKYIKAMKYYHNLYIDWQQLRIIIENSI